MPTDTKVETPRTDEARENVRDLLAEAYKMERELIASQQAHGELVAQVMGMRDGSLVRDLTAQLTARTAELDEARRRIGELLREKEQFLGALEERSQNLVLADHALMVARKDAESAYASGSAAKRDAIIADLKEYVAKVREPLQATVHPVPTIYDAIERIEKE